VETPNHVCWTARSRESRGFAGFKPRTIESQPRACRLPQGAAMTAAGLDPARNSAKSVVAEQCTVVALEAVAGAKCGVGLPVPTASSASRLTVY